MPELPLERQHLTRKEAAIYLTRHWFEIAPSTLAVKAVQKKGPPYTVVARKARYAIQALDEWARSQLQPGPGRPPAGGALGALTTRSR